MFILCLIAFIIVALYPIFAELDNAGAYKIISLIGGVAWLIIGFVGISLSKEITEEAKIFVDSIGWAGIISGIINIIYCLFLRDKLFEKHSE